MTIRTERGISRRSLSDYLAFQAVPLAIVALVGVARLGASLAGIPNADAAWLSMTVVGWAAVFYYGVAVHSRGFGSYRQLLPLVAVQTIVVQTIAVAGIGLAIAGLPNIYAAPEFSPPFLGTTPSPWAHLVAHLTIGIVAPTLLSWGVASLVLRFTTMLSSPRAVA
jgi:hypothetical protein